MTTPPGLFVTGTDTGVGKTRVAAAMTRQLSERPHRVGCLKPISTSGVLQPDGSWISPDAVVLQEALGSPIPLDRITPIVLPGEVAPSVAMRMMNLVLGFEEVLRSTDEAVIWWQDHCEILIVEGVGGLLCPVTEDSTVADLAVALDYPLVIVARRGLGTINHTLLTVEAARLRGLRIAGVILNGSEPTTHPDSEETNPHELAGRLKGIPILAQLPHTESPEALSGAMHCVDLWGLARPPRLFRSTTLAGPL